MDNRCVCGDRGREEETKCQGGRCCCGLKSSFFQLYFKMGCWSINVQFVFLLGWLDSLSCQSQELEMFLQFTKKSEESIWEYCHLKPEIIYHS